MQTYTRRFRRRSSSSKDNSLAKKEGLQEQNFFASPSKETFFPTAASVQRKCEKCREEDKNVQRLPDEKEDEKIQRTEQEEKEKEQVQRSPLKKEEEKLQKVSEEKREDDNTIQKKEAGATNGITTNASAYISSIHSKGQSLPGQQQYFFGKRMGYDFSKVKIHTDKDAALSAKEINAQAYTYANHIVFNEGKYNPETAEGKRLMAHELTHVIQQTSPDASGAEGHLQRVINYTSPAYHRADPIPKVLSGTTSTLGKTYLKINGNIIYNKDQAMRALFGAFNNNLTLRYDAASKSCKVNVQDINIEISADVQILNNPSGGKWSGTYAGNMVYGCGSKPSVAIEMDAQPSGAVAFGQRIADDEKEHVEDFMQIAKRHIDSFYAYLGSISLQSKDGSDCAALFNTEIGTKDADMIKAFVADILSAIDVHDSPTGNHHHSTTTRPGSCNPVKITANF